MSVLKRLTYLFMIALVSIASIFFIAGQSVDMLIFKYKQNAIRQEIRQKIKEEKALENQHFFSLREVVQKNAFIEDGREIVWENKYYDVVKIKFEKGHFVVVCISDDEETGLFADLDNQIKKRLSDDPSNSDYQKNLVKDFFKICNSDYIVGFIAQPEKPTSFFYTQEVLKIYLHLNIPPPKL